MLRQGTFIYDETLALVNNSGTIINGWVRQYKGEVQLNWFGDTSLEETWLKAASVNGNVQVETGPYSISSQVEDLSSYNYYSFGPVTIIGQDSIVMVNMLDVGVLVRSGDVYTQAEVDEFLALKAPLERPTFTGTVGGITKSMVGLSSVDDTSDATKNAAIATLTNKTLTSPVINTPTGIVKGDVGLGNVDNISDVDKPISTLQQAALDLKASLIIPTSNPGPGILWNNAGTLAIGT